MNHSECDLKKSFLVKVAFVGNMCRILLFSEKFVIFVARTQQIWVEWKSFTRCCQWVGKTA